MSKCYQYTADGYYAGEADDYGMLPNNATYTVPPERPWAYQWPQYVESLGWVMVEDHRERSAQLFEPDLVQAAIEYWLLDDTHSTPARQMKEIGPLPKGALTERPAKNAAELLSEAQTAKRAEVLAGYDAAVAASLTMPLASPTGQDIVIGTAAFAAEDAEGLAYVMQTHAARRDALLDLVNSADTAESVQDIVLNYAV